MCVPERRNEGNITGNSGQAQLTGVGSGKRPLPSMRGGWPEESVHIHPQFRRGLVSPEDRTNSSRTRKKAGSPETFRTAG